MKKNPCTCIKTFPPTFWLDPLNPDRQLLLQAYLIEDGQAEPEPEATGQTRNGQAGETGKGTPAWTRKGIG